MKKLIALAVLSLSATAFASSRDIFDIMYLPNAGTTYGFSQAEATNGQYKFRDADEKVKYNGYRLSQTVGHSLTDRLTLSANMNYQDLKIKTTGQDSTKWSGLSDVTVNARFRMMDEDIRWDLLGGATIGLGDRQIKSNGDMDNHQGGNSLFVGTQIGGKTDSFQWAVLGQFSRFLKSTTNDKQSDVKLKDDAHNEWLFRGDILNKLGESSYLRSAASVQFTDSFDDNDTPASTTAPLTRYTIGTEYQHLLSKDVMLRAGVDYMKWNLQSGQIKNFDWWVYRIGVNYQF